MRRNAKRVLREGNQSLHYSVEIDFVLDPRLLAYTVESEPPGYPDNSWSFIVSNVGLIIS